jgi:23S rRNA-/tRNA-specific pseudouridylate synthase
MRGADEIVVVNKPGGIPVHACGPYKYQTLPSLLVAEHGA